MLAKQVTRIHCLGLCFLTTLTLIKLSQIHEVSHPRDISSSSSPGPYIPMSWTLRYIEEPDKCALSYGFNSAILRLLSLNLVATIGESYTELPSQGF